MSFVLSIGLGAAVKLIIIIITFLVEGAPEMFATLGIIARQLPKGMHIWALNRRGSALGESVRVTRFACHNFASP